jgi:hypothetical protein
MCRFGYLTIPDPAKLWPIVADGFENTSPAVICLKRPYQ